MVKVLVKDLNEVLSCSLCNGYFQDATTLSECLDTFCRTCIIRFCLAKKQDTIPCPKCLVELGTFQHVTREGMVKDTVKQSICDVFFPPPKPEVNEETNEESLSAALLQQSKNQLASSTFQKPPPPEEIESPVKRKEKEFFPPVAPSVMPTISNPIDPKKLPPKSIQNILGHKLIAGFLANRQQPQTQNQASSSSDTDNKKRKSIGGEESSDLEKKKSKLSHDPTVRPPSATENPPASPKRAQVTPIPDEGAAPVIDTAEYNVKLSPETDLSIVGSPDNILPVLPRPTFKSALTVKVVKVQHFVYKRLEDPIRASLPGPENINILCNGQSILGIPNLVDFSSSVEGDTLSLTYYRIAK